jgi:hypothetical protein
MVDLETTADKHGYMVTPTNRGALLMPKWDVVREGSRPSRTGAGGMGPPRPAAFGTKFVGPMPGEVQTPAQLLRDFERNKGAEDIQRVFPGSETMKAGQEGFYQGKALTDERWKGLGVTTARVLRAFARAPKKIADDLSASQEVRERTLKMRDIDQKAADEGGAQIREDLQKMREFFGVENYEKVVELVRQGMKVPAAMALLGFSLKGMAAEPERR